MLTSQNLLVDLIQLEQTVMMVKHPFGMFKKLPRSQRQLSLGSLSRGAASAFLEYKFGWENLYRSIAALANVWGEVRRHKAFLRESVDRWRTISARETYSVPNPISNPMAIYSFGQLHITPVDLRADITAAFTLQIMRRNSDHVWSTMDLVTSRLGLNDLVTALWDAVPYSFVVDWFTHVNRILTPRSPSFNSFRLRRVGYSLSSKLYSAANVQLTSYGPTSGTVTREYKSKEGIVLRKYERCPGFPPNTGTVGLFGNLSITQLAEGAALIVQRL